LLLVLTALSLYRTEPVQAQYYKVILRDAELDERTKGEIGGCIGCHSPTAFLTGDLPPEPVSGPDNFWSQGSKPKTMAERGIFCDFCHTIKDFEGDKPFNHNYVSTATEAVDPKFSDLEYPWSPYHDTATNDLFESPEFCGICHNERNYYGVWVKATEFEYEESPYPAKNINCQACHMPPAEGKPAKMGPARAESRRRWFGGGFSTFVEGAAKVSIAVDRHRVRPGEEVPFQVIVHDLATGHYFPTGSTEERDVWLHVTVLDSSGNEVDHVPVNPDPSNPNDKYFIASSTEKAFSTYSKHSYADPLPRDCLPEGDRIYHGVFIDPDGRVTFGQWYAVKGIENLLQPLEERRENFTWKVPDGLAGETVILRAVLNYRRVNDAHADFLGIPRRPVREMSRDEVRMAVARP